MNDSQTRWTRGLAGAVVLLTLATLAACGSKPRPPMPGEVVRLTGPWRLEADGPIHVMDAESDTTMLTVGIVPLTLRILQWATDSTAVMEIVGFSVSGVGMLPGDVRGLATRGELFVTGAAKDSVQFTGQALRFQGRLSAGEFQGTLALDPKLAEKQKLHTVGELPTWRMFRLAR
jgi:hypothetical protein